MNNNNSNSKKGSSSRGVDADLIIRQILTKVTASGAVDHEELLSMLLEEGRRLSWQFAESADSHNNSITATSNTSSTSTAKPLDASDLADAIDGQLGEALEECYAPETFVHADESDNAYEKDEFTPQKWEAAVEDTMRSIVDPTAEEAMLTQLLHESHPHQLGTADHDHIVDGLAENTNPWSLVAPRSKSEYTHNVPAPSILSPRVAQALEDAVAELNLEAEAMMVPDGFDELVAEMADETITAADKQTDAIMQEVHQHITATGAVESEELLEGLLRQGAQLQWERAQKQSTAPAKQPSKTVADAVSSRKRAQREKARLQSQWKVAEKAARDDERMEEREKELVREMYARISNTGGADAEGVLEVLLAEAKARMEEEAAAEAAANLKSKL